MTDQTKDDDSSAFSSSEPDVLALIKKMHQQLAFLEKKIDLLISQSQERPSREKHFSRPFHSSDRPQRSGQYYNKRDQREGSGERSFYASKRPEGEGRGFGGPKKYYGDSRENSSGQEGHFRKTYGNKKSGAGPSKKLFSRKRRD